MENASSRRDGPRGHRVRAVWLLSAIALGTPLRAAGDSLDAPFAIRRTNGAITVDGDLGDPGWKDAARTDSFVEIRPGDNVAPRVRTTLWLA
ncbi:MAG: hypothetical protein ABI968_13810, partial [Acidobacteriota bacterium]